VLVIGDPPDPPSAPMSSRTIPSISHSRQGSRYQAKSLQFTQTRAAAVSQTLDSVAAARSGSRSGHPRPMDCPRLSLGGMLGMVPISAQTVVRRRHDGRLCLADSR
jgi:hypothetical protein